MGEIYRSYKNQGEFFVVYVQEAHPTDGWQSESNITESVLFRQHQNYEEREGVAQTCSLNLHIDIPILIEEIDNSIDEAYGAAPERLYLIGANGKTAKSLIKVALAPTSSTWTNGKTLSKPALKPRFNR